jgi:rubrerythrin
MFLDEALTQTAYAYDALARLAFLETSSERFMTVCKTVSQMRHVVAREVYGQGIEIEFQRLDLRECDYDGYIGRVVGNDEALMRLLEDQLAGDHAFDSRFAEIKDDLEYVRQSIGITSFIVNEHAEFFNEAIDGIRHDKWFICHDCGAARKGKGNCGRCGGKSVDRIDMI